MRVRCALAALAVPFAGGARAQAPIEDPAPPVVRALPRLAAAPQPQDFDELTTHAAPRPLSEGARTENWPGFLGPRRDGRSRETMLLSPWPEGGPALVWSMTRGDGYASPAVAGERLVYTHRRGDEVLVDCLHAVTGRRFWRFRYPTDYRAEYFSAHGPCGTPLIEGDRVFVHGVEGRLHCLELATGRVVWQRDLKREFGLEQQFFGVAGTPLLHGGRLVVNLGAPGGPSVAAFDQRSGRLVWGAGRKWGMSCASPVLRQLHGAARLFVLTGGKSRPPTGGLMVIDPITGATVSEFPFRSRRYESVNGACPVVVGSTVMLTSAYGTGTVGVRVNADGAAEAAWRIRRLGLEFATPVEVGGDLYLVDGIRDRGGAVVCLDPATGREHARTPIDWEETVTVGGTERSMGFGLGCGSLLHVGGDRFLCLTDNGHLLRLRCSPDGAEVLDRASLFHASETWTPLALSRGLLYVCQNRREKIGDAPPRLLCYDLRGGPE